MPLTFDKNQFPGINPHLHDILLHEGRWISFHGVHIGDLLKSLRAALKPLGYTADMEQSLQIMRLGVEISVSNPKSDVTIYDPVPARVSAASPTTPSTIEVGLLIPEMLIFDETDYYKAIAVYKKPVQGNPVVWVELLSPSNKPTNSDFKNYNEKRQKILESGIVFVEIDYLHLYPPTIRGVANYAAGEKDAHPYRITVMDPRPVFWEGRGISTQFDVSMTIPTVKLPLNDGDVAEFDFNVPYQKTFEETLYGDEVDYEQLPVNFETYSPEDQAFIRQRMAEIAGKSTSDT